MKRALIIICLLLLTGCGSDYRSHSTYYIDGEDRYEEECDCSCDDCETERDRIKDALRDIIQNPDDYSKSDIIRKLKEIE